ncbi:MAG: UDP-N-acetylmuramate--L-alanine ligase [Planctomycetes bacterium]|nr:UDP-N-acetylmuramate--L-alanine ligase [Planctomycetota bacterium]
MHLIGIGGCGMQGLACFLQARGARVTGSDLSPGVAAERLRREGVRVLAGHAAENLPVDADSVVISRAIPADNAEWAEARRRGLRVETYSQALGRLVRGHRGTAIGVAGTHGKTTTSAWLTHMLLLGGRDPSCIVGGVLRDLDASVRVGRGGEFVVEACEFGGSFLDLRPAIGVILNVGDDHQECYGTREGVRQAFGRFARTLPAAGLLVIPWQLQEEVGRWGVQARVLPVDPAGERGTGGEGYVLRPGRTEVSGELELLRDGEPVVPALRCGLSGRFSLANLAFAAAVACEVGVAPAAIRESAASFRGVRRRYENLGTFRGVTVIDDYAHHPAEVEAVVSAARVQFAERRLHVLFEPHQYRRLKEYLPDFARELSAADQVFITDVFAARERPEDWRGIGPEDLVEAIRGRRGQARFVSLENVPELLPGGLESGDVLLALGAGRSSEVAHALVRALH